MNTFLSCFFHISRSYATGDLNADGHPDLVVSAPGYGAPGSPQEGRVYIIYGEIGFNSNINFAYLQKGLLSC